MSNDIARRARAAAMAAGLPLLLLAACTVGDRRPDAARDSAAAGGPAPGTTPVPSDTAPAGVAAGAARPAPQPPPPPARDADQDFLRHMLDHHEAVLATAHSQMMEPAGHAAHGARADPAEFDSALDAEKQEMLRLLATLYGEKYSPRAEAADSAAQDTANGAEGGHEASQARLAAQLRAGAALVDRSLPNIRRPAVQAIARRVRTSQLAMAKQLESAGPAAR